MNCITVGYWRHPMEFFTMFIFVFAFLFFVVQFYQKLQWQSLIFAALAFMASAIVYNINYKPKVCWNEEVIFLQKGDEKQVELAWSDIEVVGGVTFRKYGFKLLTREELMESSFATSKDIYITTQKEAKTGRNQFNQDDTIVFQYRPGLLEEIEYLAGRKVINPLRK